MNNEIMLVDQKYINTMLDIIQDKKDFNLFSGRYIAPYYTHVRTLEYIAVDNTIGCEFIVESFNTQRGALDWLNGTLETRDNRLETLLNMTPVTIEISEHHKPETMLHAILGDLDDYYSVFDQFEEDEFQVKRAFYDEWYQVYVPDFESEPTFNVFIKNNVMTIESF